MSFPCLTCHAPVEPHYKACPNCGDAITPFIREYGAKPLDGKYEIVSRLGAGGMGEVYKVRHIHLDSIRVVKLMRSNIAEDQSSHDRFLREARLGTLIHHPNVATLHDFAILPDGTAYMVWEFIGGINLAEVLNQRGRLSPKVAAQLSVEALHGLEAIHRAGIVHRDVSPENLMLTRDSSGEEHIKIIDLGIAKGSGALDGQTQTGMFVGKWKYASPEHLGTLNESERIDGRADLYSFGVVMYEMLSGRPPFIAQTPHQYIVMHTKEAPAPNFSTRSEDPNARRLESLVLKALAKNRDDRFATAREFAAELAALIPHLPDYPTLDGATVDGDRTMLVSTTEVTGGRQAARTEAATSVSPDRNALRTLPASGPATLVATPAPSPVVTPTQSEPRRRNSALLFGIAAAVLLLFLGGAAAIFFVFVPLKNRDAASTETGESAPIPAQNTIALSASQTAGSQINVTSTAVPTSSATTGAAIPPPVAPASSATSAATLRSSSAETSVQRSARGQATATVPATTQAHAAAATTEESSSSLTQRGGDEVPPARISPRARPFIRSKEYQAGFTRGIIQTYNDMIAGDGVDWFAVAPKIHLAKHRIRINSFRNASGLESEQMMKYLRSDLQRALDELEGTAAPLTADGIVYWASNEGRRRGAAIEMIFRDSSGRVVAKLRDQHPEGTAEDAAQELVDIVAEFVEDHTIFEPR